MYIELKHSDSDSNRFSKFRSYLEDSLKTNQDILDQIMISLREAPFSFLMARSQNLMVASAQGFVLAQIRSKASEMIQSEAQWIDMLQYLERSLEDSISLEQSSQSAVQCLLSIAVSRAYKTIYLKAQEIIWSLGG